MDFDNEPLMSVNRIALPVLYIKLGLFQQFVKALSHESDCYHYINRQFHKSEAKIANGVFNGPEIRTLINDSNFCNTMSEDEKTAWLSFCDVASNVLGKHVSNDWKDKIDHLISSFHIMGVQRMTSKMHLLFKHKDKLERYLGRFSDENGERLHQEMLSFEKRFSSHLTAEMMAEYVWSIKRDTNYFSASKVVIDCHE